MNPEIVTSFEGRGVRRFKISRTVLVLLGSLAGAMGGLTKLLSMKGEQLKDNKSFMDSEGKRAGKISETVQTKPGKELFAVIEGPQGWIVLPVSELQASNRGHVQYSQSADQPIALVQPLGKRAAAN